MVLFKKIDPDEDDDNVFPLNEEDEEPEDVLDDEDGDEENGEDEEDIDELEEIEAKLERGEEVAISSIESSILPKSRIVYSCPRCKKIYLNSKWVKDNLTDIYSVKTELAYCPKCLGKSYGNFVGSVEIFDKKLGERKDQFIEVAHRVEREIEDAVPFEKIIDVTEKKGILFLFLNSTRLAMEIGKKIRQEFHGGVQYEWFERNQYLRIKWYDEVDNRSYFKERIRALKDRRFGMFAFEDEE